MQNLFVISGNYTNYDRPFMSYYKKSNMSNRWTPIAAMMVDNAACTVFEGKIVVSGGTRKPFEDRSIVTTYEMKYILKLDFLEAYDYHENKWSSFRSMLKQRNNHTAVSIGNKMFIAGGMSSSCEQCH